MRRWNRIASLLGWGGSGFSGFAYILRDLFTTAQAAPLTTPRTCEPGPGTLTIVDTTNKLSISGARLLASGAQTAWTDPRVTGSLITRVSGRATATRQKGASWMFGYCNTADTTPRAGIQAFSSQFFIINNNVSQALVLMTTTVDYDLMYIQGDVGAYMLVKGGAWAAWTLLWPSMYKTSTNKVGSQKLSWGVNAAAELDSIEEYDLGGIWSRSYGFASYAAYKPAQPTSLTATADLVVEVTWFTVTSSDVMDVCIRYTDDSNCWIARLDQAAGQVQLIEKNAGAETARVTGTRSSAAGSTVSVRVRAEGQRITIGSNDSVAGSYTSASFNQSVTGVKLQTSLSTAFYFNVWPLAVPTLPTTTGTAPLNLYPYGDSITVGTGDDAIYGTLGSGYPWIVCESSEATRGAGCFERPSRTAVGGRTTASAKAAIDAELAANTDTPDYILYNLGANDISAMPVQATWQTNALYIWDAMHTKWPNAKIYVMKVWIRGQNTNADTYDDTWLPTAVALRSSFVFLDSALDERVFLKGSDDGNTYTTDGIHPNHAGYVLMAGVWKTALGI